MHSNEIDNWNNSNLIVYRLKENLTAIIKRIKEHCDIWWKN